MSLTNAKKPTGNVGDDDVSVSSLAGDTSDKSSDAALAVRKKRPFSQLASTGKKVVSKVRRLSIKSVASSSVISSLRGNVLHDTDPSSAVIHSNKAPKRFGWRFFRQPTEREWNNKAPELRALARYSAEKLEIEGRSRSTPAPAKALFSRSEPTAEKSRSRFAKSSRKPYSRLDKVERGRFGGKMRFTPREVTFSVASDQYLALVEGVVNGGSKDGYLSRVFTGETPFPKMGRVMEFPYEATSGRWHVSLLDRNGKQVRLGPLQDHMDDLDGLRIAMRHESALELGPLSLKRRLQSRFDSPREIDPSTKRVMSLASQKIVGANDIGQSFLGSLSIVGFEGFDNEGHERAMARKISAKVLSASEREMQSTKEFLELPDLFGFDETNKGGLHRSGVTFLRPFPIEGKSYRTLVVADESHIRMVALDGKSLNVHSAGAGSTRANFIATVVFQPRPARLSIGSSSVASSTQPLTGEVLKMHSASNKPIHGQANVLRAFNPSRQNGGSREVRPTKPSPASSDSSPAPSTSHQSDQTTTSSVRASIEAGGGPVPGFTRASNRAKKAGIADNAAHKDNNAMGHSANASRETVTAHRGREFKSESESTSANDDKEEEEDTAAEEDENGLMDIWDDEAGGNTNFDTMLVDKDPADKADITAAANESAEGHDRVATAATLLVEAFGDAFIGFHDEIPHDEAPADQNQESTGVQQFSLGDALFGLAEYEPDDTGEETDHGSTLQWVMSIMLLTLGFTFAYAFTADNENSDIEIGTIISDLLVRIIHNVNSSDVDSPVSESVGDATGSELQFGVLRDETEGNSTTWTHSTGAAFLLIPMSVAIHYALGFGNNI